MGKILVRVEGAQLQRYETRRVREIPLGDA